MSRSANEVMALAAKAARGAGAPPAQAANFGLAAVAHLGEGRQVVELQQALAALPGGPIIDLPLGIQAVAETADRGLARGLLDDGGFVGLTQSYVSVLPYAAALDDADILTLDLNTPGKRRALTGVEVPVEVAADWHSLGARLLVPDSAASRQSGAGAGLSDND